MTDQEIEETIENEENDPIYYNPKSLNLVASVAGVLSWVILVGFIAHVVAQVVGIQAQLAGQNLALSTLITEPSFISYSFTNIILPKLTGLGLFVILQGVSIGLNVLLEIDFNNREPKN